MSPKTGAILAMAHYPLINPNTYNQFAKDKWRNRAITDPYEPGSTLKIFSAAAAIESGVSGPIPFITVKMGLIGSDEMWCMIHVHTNGFL
jgi:cell division protein FtsI/penicillin-binding protein 2